MTASAPEPDEGPTIPQTGIEIEAHFHYGMTGSFPLRLGDLFFAADGLYIVEYSYITPFIGLTAGKHKREAASMRGLIDRHGIDAVLLVADRFIWHAYGDLDRVVVHEGGWFGRPKVAVYPSTGPSHAFRFHDRPVFEEGRAELEGVADRYGFHVEERSGLGFTPWESIVRFFWKD